MAQPQGTNTSAAGRLDGSLSNTFFAAADAAVVLGAGWGTTATFAIAAGSNDQRGTITITSNGTGQAQASANVTIAFKDGTYGSVVGAYVPQFEALLQSSSNGPAEPQPTNVTNSLTAPTFRAGALPVAAATYRYVWKVIA